MTRFFRSLYCLVAGVAVMLSCQQSNEPDVPRGASVSTDVRFNVSVSGHGMTRSSAGVQEDEIRSIQIFAYSGGVLEGEVFTTGVGDAALSLLSGKTYRFYVLANCARMEAPASESGLASYRYKVTDRISPFAGGFPMSSVSDVKVSGKGMSVTILLERMVARIQLRLSPESIPGLKVNSVRIMNSPADMTPFVPESAAESSYTGDKAIDTDIMNINAGGSASFYMLENCQGVLLLGNDDPWQKIPENLPVRKEDLCTYMEVAAELDGSSGMQGPVIYRFYLGQDVTSDFSIYRNTVNEVTLTATEDGLGRVSWRILCNAIPVEVPVVVVGSKGLVAYTGSDGMLKGMKVGTSTWNSVIYAAGKYVAVGDDGCIAYSTNGKTWTLTVNGQADWQDVVYGNGYFVTAGYYSRPVFSSPDPKRNFGCRAYSRDGVTWTVSEDADFCWLDVAYGNGRFVAAGYWKTWDSSRSSGRFTVSSDARNWDVYSVPSRYYSDIVYGEGKFCALTSGTFVYSADGASWSSSSFSGVANLDTATYGNGAFVSVGRFGNIAFSDDGQVWEQVHSAGFACRAVTYGNGRFVTVGDGGKALYSADGKKWYEMSTGLTDALYGVAVMPE